MTGVQTCALPIYQPQSPFDIPGLPQAFDLAGRTWCNDAESHASYLSHIKALQGHRWNLPVAQCDTDAARGSLADVAWEYALFGDSERPGNQTVGHGAAWTAQMALEIARSPPSGGTAVIITWDDWGGWHDPISAPQQSTWGGTGPAGYTGSQFRSFAMDRGCRA